MGVTVNLSLKTYKVNGMNYTRIYNALINRAKSRDLNEYYEKHHIVPRCLGGSDDITNLVKLTPEEHYLAHQLLVKMYPESNSLIYAATMMIPSRPTNKLYGWLRRKLVKALSVSQSGKRNSQYGTIWITNGKTEKKINSVKPIPKEWTRGRLIKSKKVKENDVSKEKTCYYHKLHEIYKKDGFQGVVNAGYTKSKPNLVMRLAKYVPEFKPQNGKKRGINKRDIA